MEKHYHRFHDLFAQLGLPADDASILRFLALRSPIPPALELHQAPFWSVAQATFLKEVILEDADWAEVADQLNVVLRAEEPGPVLDSPLRR
jgi:hypothetical protein